MNSFKMKDLGSLQNCLGIGFKKQNNSLCASQTKYIKDILLKFGMDTSKPVKTPMVTGLQLKRNESKNLPDL